MSIFSEKKTAELAVGIGAGLFFTLLYFTFTQDAPREPAAPARGSQPVSAEVGRSKTASSEDGRAAALSPGEDSSRTQGEGSPLAPDELKEGSTEEEDGAEPPGLRLARLDAKDSSSGSGAMNGGRQTGPAPAATAADAGSSAGKLRGTETAGSRLRAQRKRRRKDRSGRQGAAASKDRGKRRGGKRRKRRSGGASSAGAGKKTGVSGGPLGRTPGARLSSRDLEETAPGHPDIFYWKLQPKGNPNYCDGCPRVITRWPSDFYRKYGVNASNSYVVAGGVRMNFYSVDTDAGGAKISYAAENRHGRDFPAGTKAVLYKNRKPFAYVKIPSPGASTKMDPRVVTVTPEFYRDPDVRRGLGMPPR